MNLNRLNTICYTISLISIIVGAVLLVAIIWNEQENVVLWRSMATVGVCFLASSLTLSINKMIER